MTAWKLDTCVDDRVYAYLFPQRDDGVRWFADPETGCAINKTVDELSRFDPELGTVPIPPDLDLPPGFQRAGFLNIFYRDKPICLRREPYGEVSFGSREWSIVWEFFEAKGGDVSGAALLTDCKTVAAQSRERKRIKSAIYTIRLKLEKLHLTISGAEGEDDSRCLCELTEAALAERKDGRRRRKKSVR